MQRCYYHSLVALFIAEVVIACIEYIVGIIWYL
jgi:hypothetical protein